MAIELSELSDKSVKKPAFALTMVKPHATAECAEVIIAGIIDRTLLGYVPYLNLAESVQAALTQVSLVHLFYRNLSNGRYAKVLYEKERTRPFYPYLVEENKRGTSSFLIFSSQCPSLDLYELLQAFKGFETLTNSEGRVVRPGSRIRGYLKMPGVKVDPENLNNDQR